MVKVLKHYYSYSYLIFNPESGDALLVDPSWNADNIQKNLAGLKLKGLLLTHHHFDHVNLVDKLVSLWNVPVFMSKVEIDCYKFRCGNLNAIEKDGVLSFGKIDATAILTPGHTKGGMCYQIGNDVFTGDTIFIEGCGICNLDGSSPYEMYESIQKLKRLLSQENLLYPGHSYGEHPGKPFSFVLQNNIYFSLDNCEQFVSFRMRKNQKNLFNFK